MNARTDPTLDLAWSEHAASYPGVQPDVLGVIKRAFYAGAREALNLEDVGVKRADIRGELRVFGQTIGRR